MDITVHWLHCRLWPLEDFTYATVYGRADGDRKGAVKPPSSKNLKPRLTEPLLVVCITQKGGFGSCLAEKRTEQAPPPITGCGTNSYTTNLTLLAGTKHFHYSEQEDAFLALQRFCLPIFLKNIYLDKGLHESIPDPNP